MSRHHRLARLAIVATASVTALAACAADGDGLPAGVTFDTGGPTTSAAPASTDAVTASTGPSTTVLPDVALSFDTVSFDRVTTGLDQPVDLATRPGDPTVYVVQKTGTVVPVDLAADGTGVIGAPVLDISDLVSTGGEQGLLSLEFHPTEPFAYADYTDLDGDTQVVEFEVADATDGSGHATLDATSRRTLLTVQQPYPNHNGGDLAFDAEGMLYITLGDGGAGGDPDRVAQNVGSMLGKILRIDPRPSTDEPYAVPADNPYVGIDGANPEIWSLGVRNPWRIDIDPVTGELWIADVGQGDWEEVDAVDSGRGVNFGWSAWEGTHRFNDDQSPDGATPPVFEYPHGDAGCSVSGGAVLRSSPTGVGWFVFSDYCTGKVWAMRRDDGLDRGGSGPVRLDAGDEAEPGLGNINAVRRGPDGVVYVLATDGELLRLSVARP